MVNLTRIYTRTGDDGTTNLGDISTTSKLDLRLAAYADVDEANAQIGLALRQVAAVESVRFGGRAVSSVGPHHPGLVRHGGQVTVP